MTDGPDAPPPATGAWTLTYSDGAANHYQLTAVGAGADVELVYTPITAATSSSGMYSGGPPRRARLAPDAPRLARLWACVDDAAAGGEPAGPRGKGTGALDITGAGRDVAVLVGGPAQRALEELLAGIDDDPVDDARAAQDRRLRLSAPLDAPPGIRTAILAAVRARVGWPALAISQDEAVVVDDPIATPTGWQARVAYTLDRDFASQYDRTETVTGVCTVAGGGAAIDVRWDEPPPADLVGS